jgi:hypothetical protein
MTDTTIATEVDAKSAPISTKPQSTKLAGDVLIDALDATHVKVANGTNGILADCYGILLNLEDEKKARELMVQTAKERDLGCNARSQTAALILKIVYGKSDRNASAYAKVLNTARKAKVEVSDFADWLADTGIENARRYDRPQYDEKMRWKKRVEAGIEELQEQKPSAAIKVASGNLPGAAGLKVVVVDDRDPKDIKIRASVSGGREDAIYESFCPKSKVEEINAECLVGNIKSSSK